jgi:hypothetical protein
MTGNAARRPRTGEARKVRQPLGIDRLPLAMQDHIRAARIAGRTWMEIEEDSPSWKEWNDGVATEVYALFPGRRLPHSNLHRWYDLRVSQVMKEQEQRSIAAHAAADKVAGRGFSNLTESVKHAMGETVFELMNNEHNPMVIAEALADIGLLLARFDRNELARTRVEQEQQKIELLGKKLELMKGSVKGLKDAIEKKEVTPEQLQQKLDQIYGIAE